MISGGRKLKKIESNKKYNFKQGRQYYFCSSKGCKKVFKTKIAFQHHAKVCHTLLQEKNSTHNSKTMLSCKLCNYTTQNSGNMFVHQRKHTKIRPYHCKLCTQSYGHRTNLRNHIMSFHWNYKQYPCPRCDLSFALKSYLKQHMRKHRGKLIFFTFENDQHRNSHREICE